MELKRTNTSKLGRWWWTVDRYTLIAVAVLVALGAIMSVAASPSVAVRVGYEPFHFVKRQVVFLFLACFTMFGLSLLNHVQIRRIAVLGFLGSLVLLMLLPLIGYENKGSTRWMHIAGMSIQPSEFMKPCFAVVMAWIFSEGLKKVSFPGYRIALVFYALVVFLLIIQPDFGMAVTVSVVFMAQIFMAGLPFFWLVLMGILALLGVFGAYNFLPHVQGRIDRFLDPSSGDNYQVAKSLEAFQNGGILGQGPGEGHIKQSLPDSHTDFVFAVAGEEFGAILCLFIIVLFSCIVLRGFYRVMKERDLFILLSVVGLLTQFGIQAVINMGVAVNLLPAKGMTLPFLSYGGSSLIAIALGMGMVLALTRLRYGYQAERLSS
jgi:cell division protein FtsW